MCGFAVSNITRLKLTNNFCQRRGPDLTNSKVINGIEFLHNLLHITGELTPQPIVRDDVVCVFNGEIYNYKNFGNYKSDGECIIDLYEKEGDEFVSQLDGEFALCLIDFTDKKIIIANDTFSCKPLWYEFTNGKFGVASYESQLTGLGFTSPKKLQTNLTQVYDTETLQKIKQYNNFTFCTHQHKNSFDDWLAAFGNSIRKRTANTSKGMFVGMSSGYDSGAIACELTKQGIDFKAYSILNNENDSVLQQRLRMVKNSEAFFLKQDEFQKWK